MRTTESAEALVRAALQATAAADHDRLRRLDDVPTAIYATDATGVVTYYNKACIGFAGRSPAVGKDRWCVTWKLYTPDGQFLPHDHCPMAVAVRERRSIRGVTAFAERPDGSRVAFMPYPTPRLAGGELLGAVNALIEISPNEHVELFRAEAARCWRLAFGISDRQACEALRELAQKYDAMAQGLGGRATH